MAIVTESDEPIIEAAIRKASAELPDYVTRVVTEFGQDWTGDPAVWFYVILKDEVTSRTTFYEDADKAAEVLRQAMIRTGTNRFPYVRVRTVSEQASVENESKREVVKVGS